MDTTVILRIYYFEKNVHEEKYENKFNIFRGKIIYPQHDSQCFS
jgi:hypothetical protein